MSLKSSCGRVSKRYFLVLIAVVDILLLFTLEVLGAGGATWGFSDIVRLRTETTNNIWRLIAAFVTAVALIRFVGIHFIHRASFEVFDSVRTVHEKHHVTKVQEDYLQTKELFVRNLQFPFASCILALGYKGPCIKEKPKKQKKKELTEVIVSQKSDPKVVKL